MRRWKQVIEARALVKALEQGPRTRYRRETKEYVYGPVVPTPGCDVRATPNYNHPACRMWRGWVPALKWYTNEMLIEVVRRGTHRVTAFGPYDLGHGPRPIPLPPWLGNEKFHIGQMSNLLRKDPVHYGQFGWCVPDDLPYAWPLPDGTYEEKL